ncbi:unnamed protein product [Coregonus sp. 'balchen']|nr:unnamed protein product [Coregonus sp. 'balchen']
MMKVKWNCNGGHTGTWTSSPDIREMADVQLLTAVSVLFSGGTYTELQDWTQTMNLKLFGSTTIYQIQNTYLAKYTTYTLMTNDTNEIVHSELIQVTEAPSSVAIEVIGFKWALTELLDNMDLQVDVVTSDHSPSIRKMMRELFSDIQHELDTTRGLLCIGGGEVSKGEDGGEVRIKHQVQDTRTLRRVHTFTHVHPFIQTTDMDCSMDLLVSSLLALFSVGAGASLSLDVQDLLISLDMADLKQLVEDSSTTRGQLENWMMSRCPGRQQKQTGEGGLEEALKDSIRKFGLSVSPVVLNRLKGYLDRLLLNLDQLRYC